MQKITLDEFCAHWVREREKGGWDPFLPSRLAGNTFDFATEAGQYSRRQFLASFPSGGFCGRHMDATYLPLGAEVYTSGHE